MIYKRKKAFGVEVISLDEAIKTKSQLVKQLEARLFLEQMLLASLISMKNTTLRETLYPDIG